MHALRRMLSRLLHWILMVMLIVLAVVTFAQIIARYLLEYPLFWSEELALTLMVWITFVGAALILERNEHVSIDILVDRLPRRVEPIVRGVGLVCMFVFNVALTYGAYLVVESSKDSITPGLRISVGWQYGGVLVGGALLVLVSLEHLYGLFSGKQNKEESGR